MNKINFNFHNSYEKLPKVFYEKIKPNKRLNPEILLLNENLGEKLNLNIDGLKESEDILSGSEFPKGFSHIAQAYMGHQFGFLTMLGDGRAVLLGEHIADGNRYDIQLKGSGRTSFSRGGDGNATLGPMLREYIISEGLFHLGVPSSRSLAITTTGEKVLRNSYETGAVLTRVAKSHIRVGTFQYGRAQGIENLKILADYSIKRHFPELENHENKYLDFFIKVLDKQIETIALWQSIGFVHGVMNTDNMTITGETIDYGPCAFIDKYDLKTVFSSIDRTGRYAFGNQPKIGLWNLSRFAETLIPLISEDSEESISLLEKELEKYPEKFENEYQNIMAEKLGIENYKREDGNLISEFLSLLDKYNLDYANSFLDLSYENLEKPVYNQKDFKEFLKRWEERISKEEKSDEELKKFMLSKNPQIIPRNYYVQMAIDEGEKGNLDEFLKLLKELKTPFEENIEKEKYKEVPDMEYITYCGT